MTVRAWLLVVGLTAVLPGCDLLAGSEGDPLDTLLSGGGSVAGWLGIPAVGYAMNLARRLRVATEAPSRAAADVARLEREMQLERQANIDQSRRLARVERLLMEQGIVAGLQLALDARTKGATDG